VASSESFHKAQTSRVSTKATDIHGAIEARRQALTKLAELAAALLRNAKHNPAPDTIHRVTTSLEAISAYAARPDAPRPGRLTQDLDPPGFELFGASPSGAPVTSKTKPFASLTSKHESGKRASAEAARRIEEIRKANIAAARAALQEAKKSLSEARAKVQNLESGQKKVLAEAKEAEKLKREAEQRLEKAKAAADVATQRAQNVSVEAREAAKAVKDCERSVEEASRKLEKLFAES